MLPKGRAITGATRGNARIPGVHLSCFSLFNPLFACFHIGKIFIIIFFFNFAGLINRRTMTLTILAP